MTAIVDHVHCNDHYNDLPSLKEASISCQVASIDDIINGPIRDVFLKHSAQITFCLYLQHRHHTVGINETIIKVGGTAHLMDSQVIKDIVSIGNRVIPTTWMTFDGNVLPMEFAVSPAATTAPAPPTPAFMSDFLSALALNGCSGLFGIDTIAEGAWSEIKIGNASVVVSSNDSESYDQDEFIPVAFAFDEKKPTYRVHGKCGTNHRHTSKPQK